MTTQQEPIVMVIFGANGDLTWRKLVPALYNLFLDHRLPERFAVVGVARHDMDDTAFRQRLREGVDLFSRRGKVEEQNWNEFASRLTYFVGDFTAPAPGAPWKRASSPHSSCSGSPPPTAIRRLACPPS